MEFSPEESMKMGMAGVEALVKHLAGMVYGEGAVSEAGDIPFRDYYVWVTAAAECVLGYNAAMMAIIGERLARVQPQGPNGQVETVESPIIDNPGLWMGRN